MALSDSVSTNHFSDSAVNETYMTFRWWATQNKDGNYSDVSWEIVAHRPGTNNYVYFHNFNRTVNGSWASKGSTRYAEGDIIDNGSFRVQHDNSTGDGSFSISMSANVYYNGSGYISASQTFYLDRIPRYANFTEHYVKSTGLNSISVRWNADHSIDWVQYSLNGAAWADTSGLDYTIGGLGPNTSYSIKTRIRRKDSGLWTESGTIYGTTKDIARITEAINVNDEQKPYMKYTNPSGSYFNPYIELVVNGSITNVIVKSSINKTSGEYTFELTEDEKELIYQKSANSPTIGIRYGVETLGSNNNKYWHWSDKTMTIINADPVFTDFTIEENNEKVFALTGDRYKHIKKYSSLKILITSGNKMIPQKSATAVKYRVVVGQQTKDITYSENDTYQIIDNMDANTVQVFAVDSRKKETLKEKSLDIINYKELALNNIEFNRKNGVEETVIITGNGTWTNVDFGEVINSIKTFAFRCKKKKEIAWSDWYSIKELFHINEDGKFNNKVENEFTATTFDFGEEYDVEVKIEDELSTVVRPASVNSGKILMSALKEYGVCFGGIYEKSEGAYLQFPKNQYMSENPAINLRNSDIIGINTICFADEADTDTKGLRFLKENATPESINPEDYEILRGYRRNIYYNNHILQYSDTIQVYDNSQLYIDISTAWTDVKMPLKNYRNTGSAFTFDNTNNRVVVNKDGIVDVDLQLNVYTNGYANGDYIPKVCKNGVNVGSGPYVQVTSNALNYQKLTGNIYGIQCKAGDVFEMVLSVGNTGEVRTFNGETTSFTLKYRRS